MSHWIPACAGMTDFSFDFDLPPHKVCRALPVEGQSAREGGLSFDKQGRASKRPGNEVNLSILAN